MAHGYLAHFAQNSAAVYSAGIETHGLNPNAVSIMKEDGIDISHHTSNHVDEYQNIVFDYIITVCDHAHENCPYIPSKDAKRMHRNFFDPSKIKGDTKQVQANFEKARNEIKAFCNDFVNKYL